MRAAVVLVAVAALVSGCALSSGGPTPVADTRSVTADAGDVSVTGAFITSPGTRGYTAGGTATAQFTMSDSGSQWDTLTSVSTSVAGSVRLLLFDREQDQISVPTGGGAEAASCELIDLDRPLVPGERVALTFQFTNAGALTLDVPVH
jgi:copper(I)-binding protein